MTDEIVKMTHEELLEERKIIINGDVNSNIIECAVMQILRWNEEDSAAEDSKTYKREDNPIRIYINSPGGRSWECFALVSAISTSKTPVYTYALGYVGSAAFIIFVVGKKRFTQPYSRFLYHDCASLYGGKTEEIEESLIDMKKTSLLLQGIVKQHTKIPQKTLDKIHREKLEQHWLAPEMIKMGACDSYF